MTNELTAAEPSDSDPLIIEDLLQEVIRGLVDVPSAVLVEDKGKGTQTCILFISTDPSDIGKVLGKQGTTIAAIRELFTKIARVGGRKCILEINDPRAR